MRFYTLFFVLLSCHLFAQNPVDKVDVFIGTGGNNGQLDPAVSVPFGLIKPGPIQIREITPDTIILREKLAGFLITEFLVQVAKDQEEI